MVAIFARVHNISSALQSQEVHSTILTICKRKMTLNGVQNSSHGSSQKEKIVLSIGLVYMNGSTRSPSEHENNIFWFQLIIQCGKTSCGGLLVLLSVALLLQRCAVQSFLDDCWHTACMIDIFLTVLAT